MGNPTQYAVVSTAAAGGNPTVVSFRVSDLAAGPQSANLGTQAQTPSVPLTPAGLNPGSPGSGVATTPAIYVPCGVSGTARVHRLSQTGNSQTLTNAPSATPHRASVPGARAQPDDLRRHPLRGPHRRLDRGQPLRPRRDHARGPRHPQRDQPDAGSTGFLRNEPTIGQNNIFISRDNGDSLVLSLSDAQPLPSGFTEDAGNAGAVASYGRPAVARWYASSSAIAASSPTARMTPSHPRLR